MGEQGDLQRAWQFSKTKLCKFHIIGICAKGTMCPFAHNKDELKPLPDLAFTKLCKTLIQNGECTNRNCTYAHTKEELRATSTFHKTKLCRFSQMGHCALGAKCNFAHSTEEMRQLEADIARLEELLLPQVALVPGYLGMSGGLAHPQYSLAPTMMAPEIKNHVDTSKHRGGRRGKERNPQGGKRSAAVRASGTPNEMPLDEARVIGSATPARKPAVRAKQSPGVASSTMLSSAEPVDWAALSSCMGGLDSFRDSPAYVRTASDFVVENSFLNVGGAGAFPLSPVCSASSCLNELGQMPVAEAGVAAAGEMGYGYAEWLAAEEALPNGLCVDWNSALLNGRSWDASFLKGGSFEVDQKDDTWQVKNTFLTFAPQAKPIRSVRTADGALCSLASSQE